MNAQHTMRGGKLGALVPVVYASAALVRSTHTLEDVQRIEQDTGLCYAGSVLDDGDVTYIPVFVKGEGK